MTVAELKSILSNCKDDAVILLEEPLGEGIYQMSLMLGARKEGDTITFFSAGE